MEKKISEAIEEIVSKGIMSKQVVTKRIERFRNAGLDEDMILSIVNDWLEYAEDDEEEKKEVQEASEDCKILQKLFSLISENPQLPVTCMVSGEVCGGDEYAYWEGSIQAAEIAEIVQGEEKVLTKSDFYSGDGECDWETLFFDYYGWWHDDSDSDLGKMSDEDAEAFMKKKVSEIPWKKTIVLYIGLPD